MFIWLDGRGDWTSVVSAVVPQITADLRSRGLISLRHLDFAGDISHILLFLLPVINQINAPLYVLCIVCINFSIIFFLKKTFQ